MGNNKGIFVAGNIIADIVKNIDCYPEKGMMSYVTNSVVSVGGCVPNTSITLAKIDKDISLFAGGKIGNDYNGKFIVSKLENHNINCENIKLSDNRQTSSSDVMSEIGGERTFFHCKGANAEYSPADIDIDNINCDMFHIGYIHLLDEFDRYDADYGTVMARFLADLQNHGVKTSIDVVSDSTANYKERIIPALKYCDYAIMNEVECTKLTDLSPYDEKENLNIQNIQKTMEYMAECGVRSKVIIHCKKAGFCLDVPTKQFTMVPSLNIPKEKIKGSVGAGDAFCAGCLYGLYKGFGDQQILEFASGSAASNLFADNSVDGILSANEIYALINKYGRIKL